MNTGLFLILLVFEILKVSKTKVKAHFLKKLDFVTNKCLALDVFGECLRTTEKPFKIYTITAFTSYSYYLVYSTKLSQ